MNRWFPVSAFALFLLAACSTSKPAVAVNPVTDPAIVGAIDESAREGSIAAEEGARTGRRIGTVAGIAAAVLGGPHHDSVDDAVARFLVTRAAAETAGTIIGGSRGARDGAKRGFELDLQFAELHKIEGVDVTRPMPDQIDVRFATSPAPQTLAQIAAVFPGREERAIDIQGPDDASFAVRESLIDLGLPSAAVQARRNDHMDGIILRIRYRD
jgi:hypothetical protein